MLRYPTALRLSGSSSCAQTLDRRATLCHALGHRVLLHVYFACLLWVCAPFGDFLRCQWTLSHWELVKKCCKHLASLSPTSVRPLVLDEYDSVWCAFLMFLIAVNRSWAEKQIFPLSASSFVHALLPCFGSDAFALACHFGIRFASPLPLCDAMCFAMLCHALSCFAPLTFCGHCEHCEHWDGSTRVVSLCWCRQGKDSCCWCASVIRRVGLPATKVWKKLKVLEHLGTWQNTRRVEKGFSHVKSQPHMNDFMDHFECHLSPL